MNHVEKAVEYYNNNFNCSQGVFTSFATEMGMDEKLALKLATNFGGGERKGELCGAVAGALMVLGLRCGHCDSEDIEGKSNVFENVYTIEDNPFLNSVWSTMEESSSPRPDGIPKSEQHTGSSKYVIDPAKLLNLKIFFIKVGVIVTKQTLH